MSANSNEVSGSEINLNRIQINFDNEQNNSNNNSRNI
jgi:hypothetical protein